jgi:hypothetical protein
VKAALRSKLDGNGRWQAFTPAADSLYRTARSRIQPIRDDRVSIGPPEAHLHPHLQRLVYPDFLRRRTHLESSVHPELERPATSVIMTTHSPHIVSVSPLSSLVLLRKTGDGSTEGSSTALLQLEDSDREDLEQYLDVTRGELLFAKGILLVEGDAELVCPAGVIQAHRLRSRRTWNNGLFGQWHKFCSVYQAAGSEGSQYPIRGHNGS